jgi:NAD(P)-dependent dehydrogenase (short-subunit alcohol dehydrogenase family)
VNSRHATVSFDFTGCTALITGGTSNLGLAFATSFARAGAAVGVIGGSDSSALRRTLDELRASGATVAGALADFADASAVVTAATAITDTLGPVDILVNNAGVRFPRLPEDLTIEEWDRTVAVNLRAPLVLAKHVLPAMLTQRFGRIVNIAGLNIWWASSSSAHVSAAKSGLLGLTASLAMRGAGSGVTVNTIVPGFIDTPSYLAAPNASRDETVRRLVPMARGARMEEIVDTGLFLASESASYITGQALTVSGGASPMVGS